MESNQAWNLPFPQHEEKKRRFRSKKRTLGFAECQELQSKAIRESLKSVESMDTLVLESHAKKPKEDVKYENVHFRGSRFRGISKNKGKWQVMITFYHSKVYMGALPCEELAARTYDRLAILTKGLKVKQPRANLLGSYEFFVHEARTAAGHIGRGFLRSAVQDHRQRARLRARKLSLISHTICFIYT